MLRPAVDEKYIRPKKANDLMRSAQNIHQTVYLYGPTGFGKTTLAADFLARRKYEYYSAADSCLMENDLLTELKENRERIIVIDDLHCLQETEERELLFQTLQTLIKNPHVWLILISRAPVPAWLKPLYIEHLFVIIHEEELAFTPQDEVAYLDQWQLSLMNSSLMKLREYGKGHPLFLRIMAMHLVQLPKDSQNSAARAKKELETIEAARRDCWDYLETHVYDQWDLPMQEFLMDISIVDRFDLQMAQMITKKNDAGRIILAAQETGDFLIEIASTESIVYELRPAMILSMRRRLLKKCTKTHIDQLYYSAGTCYEMQGRVIEALQMYQKCHQKESISRILIENARNHPGSGRYWELRRYYLELPEEMIRESSELISAMSMLQSIMLNDEESERWYQELVTYAKTHTGSAKREAQARLLYLDVALPQRGTVHMKDILTNAWTLISKNDVTLPEISLTNNQPSIMNGGKDFSSWSRNDRALAATIGRPVELLLGKFGKGLVNLSLAESFFEKGRDSYEVAVLAGKGRMQAESGGKQEQVFVAVSILAQLSIFNNHIKDAIESVDSFKSGCDEHALQLCNGIDAFKIRILLYTAQTGEIAELMKNLPDEDKEFCTLERYRYITKARVYLFMGKKEKALLLLERILLYAEKRSRTFLQIETNILLAIAQYRRNQPVWKELLQKAVAQAEDYHFVRVLSREGAALWELFKAAEFSWKDPSFKKQVLQECEQMASLYPSYLKEKNVTSVSLSDMAVKILRMQAEGMNVGQIADAVGLSKAGVKYYNQETYKKLNVSSKGAAINEAKNQKLI